MARQIQYAEAPRLVCGANETWCIRRVASRQCRIPAKGVVALIGAPSDAFSDRGNNPGNAPLLGALPNFAEFIDQWCGGRRRLKFAVIDPHHTGFVDATAKVNVCPLRRAEARGQTGAVRCSSLVGVGPAGKREFVLAACTCECCISSVVAGPPGVGA